MVHLRFAQLGVGTLVALAVLRIAVNSLNYQTSAHFSAHEPYFNTQFLNRAFSIFNTLPLGASQTMFQVHHLNHHQFNNDQAARDHSSKYRFGNPEPLWKYALLGPIRTRIEPFYLREARRRGVWGDMVEEFLELCVFRLCLLILSPVAFFCFYLPTHYLGGVLAHAENYLQHAGTAPGNIDLHAAVSWYHPFYNRLLFNCGYHREHHREPRRHWSRLPEIRES
jgi:fatty acid desaturase